MGQRRERLWLPSLEMTTGLKTMNILRVKKINIFTEQEEGFGSKENLITEQNLLSMIFSCSVSTPVSGLRYRCVTCSVLKGSQGNLRLMVVLPAESPQLLAPHENTAADGKCPEQCRTTFGWPSRTHQCGSVKAWSLNLKQDNSEGASLHRFSPQFC